MQLYKSDLINQTDVGGIILNFFGLDYLLGNINFAGWTSE